MSFKDIKLKTVYRSKLDNVIQDFYNPVLEQAILYKRAVGFFSSSALVSITPGICGLIRNGGKIELIASPRLSSEDIAAINEGLRHRDDVITEVLLRDLQDPKGKFEEIRLNLLCNLIAANKLTIKIAFLEEENTVGMFHEKLGLMYDNDGNIISFSGSMNESVVAFKINYESIKVFTSWSTFEELVYEDHSTFNAMWSDIEPGIKVIEFPKVKDEILKRYKKNNEIDLNLDEYSYGYDVSTLSKNNLSKNVPIIPANVRMREYQIQAIDEWEKRNYVGIFDMATGTGKTYTALAAVTRLFSKLNNNLAVIIVCPYQHLVEQWKDDIVAFGMKPIVCYSASTQKNWRERVKNAIHSFNLGVTEHFCIVTTNATFSSDYVHNLVVKLHGNVLIVVDEAHNFGANYLSKTLPQNIKYRLALSATIDRHGDHEGTKKLYDYFGAKCIEYTLKDAIDNSMLTPYYYYPVVVSLSENELSKYIDLTLKIRKNVHVGENGKYEPNEYAKRLLIERARLVAGACEKITKLRYLISEKYLNDNQMLVYCGAATMEDIDYKEGDPPVDEVRQIDIVADMLGNDLGMRVTKFTSEEKADERRRIIKVFAEGTHLQALVAIRCLDEGVNVPSIKTAFILASSTNPKEYIQRRGRVLRKFPGKNRAVIYDFVTLPISIDKLNEYESDVIESVKSLAKREILRIKDFADIAENPFDSDSLIADLRRAYDIDTLENGADYV